MRRLGETGDIVALPAREAVVRIAIVSDIHGNRTAFEAVLADLRQTSPDLILHGWRTGIRSRGDCGPDSHSRLARRGWQYG